MIGNQIVMYYPPLNMNANLLIFSMISILSKINFLTVFIYLYISLL